MEILDIVTYPSPLLRKKTSEVTSFDQDLATLAENMIHTMYEKGGIGLAAPQVGKLVQLIVIDTSPERNKPLALVNPKITDRSTDRSILKEGCLSFPLLGGRYLKSYSLITVQYQTLSGEFVTVSYSGLTAACIQHEIDHLKGKLFIDRKLIKVKKPNAS